MHIGSIPENFSGVFSGPVFSIEDADPQYITEVGIYDTENKLLGKKRFYGEERYTVSVAPYMIGTLEIEPIVKRGSGFLEVERRCAKCYISVRQIQRDGTFIGTTVISEAVTLTCGTANSGKIGSLHRLENRTISSDEYDEICFTSNGIAVYCTISIQGETGEVLYLGKNGLQDAKPDKFQSYFGANALFIDMAEITEKFHSECGEATKIDMEIIGERLGSTEFTVAKRTYTVTGPKFGSVRLCWLNGDGGLDYHTFNDMSEEMIYPLKSKVYTKKGYEMTRCEAESKRNVISEYEPEMVLRDLSQIVTSPKVWIITADGKIPVDVEADKVVIKENDPLFLSFVVKSIKKQRSQYGL